MNTPEQPPTEVKTAVEPTVVDEKLQLTIQQAQLEPATAQGLLAAFRPLFAKANEICATAANLSVTDATQVTEIKQARTLRLALRAIRVDAEKTRKVLKEDSLRRGKAIDGVYNVLEYAVAPVETKLLEMEQIAERAEAARKAALKSKREELLKPYGIDTTFYQLSDMSEPAFVQLLDNTRTAYEAKAAAARKAEEERVAREKADAEERERVRLENERLKREAVEREKAAQEERARLQREKDAIEERAKADREAAEAKAKEEKRKSDEASQIERERASAEKAELERKAREERAAREKIEAEERARKAAEEKRKHDAAEAAERAAAAPDREKLASFAASLRALQLPTMATPAGATAARDVAASIEELAVNIELRAQKLGRRSAA